MPTNTFLHLPAAKRARVIRAARQEFSLFSFADASINRIIQSAGIPRGSFYQYFSDKDDLFFYIAQEPERQFSHLLTAQLKRCGNDLGAALLSAFDLWFLQQTVPTHSLYQQISLLKCNPLLDWQLLFRARETARRLSAAQASLHHSGKPICSEATTLLLCAFTDACKRAFFEPATAAQAREELARTFLIILRS